tara:strand:- start:2286 stop:2510 length:225 start_codon:yes stop_codon:yes gene_type:complete
MKSYMVFECENFRFTWAGGVFINVHQIIGDTIVYTYDGIENWGLESTNEDIASICLEWLVDEGVISEAELYSLN